MAAPPGTWMNNNNHVKVAPLNSGEFERERRASAHDAAARITFRER